MEILKKLFIISIMAIALLGFVGLSNAYTVQSGDNMWGIAQKTGIKFLDLIRYNPQVKDASLIYPGQELNTGIETQEVLLGSTLPVAGNTYYLAGSGITGSATSITLTKLTIPQTGYELQDSDFSSTFYVTLEPGSTKRQEIVSCTTVTQNANDTATLSGCSRGLTPFTPFTASTTYQFSHAGGTQVIFSDPPQLFNEYTAKGNNEAITGYWTFPTPLSSSSTAAATVGYANGLVASGVATSSESNFGGVWLGDQTSMASSSYNINSPRSVYTRYTTSSPDVRGLYIPVAQNNGYLASGWGGTASSLATLDSNTLVVQNPANAVVTSSVNKIPKGNNTDGRLDERWGKFGGDGSDGALNITTGTTTLDISSATTLIKEYTSININAGGGLAFSNSASAGSVIILRSQGDCTIGGIVDASGLGANGSAGGAGGADGVGAAGTAGISASGFIFDAVEHAGAAGSGGAVSVVAASGGSATPVYPGQLFYRQQGFHQMIVAPGSGGGGGGGGGESAAGGGGTGGAGGAGGKGGGGIIIECAGTYNATGTIMATGVDGTDGGAEASSDEAGGGGGGGGGAGGDIFVLYNLSDTDTATYTVTGGAASSGGAGSGDTTGDATGGGGGAGGSNSTGAGTSGLLVQVLLVVLAESVELGLMAQLLVKKILLSFNNLLTLISSRWE
jgi:hypothetical protein